MDPPTSYQYIIIFITFAAEELMFDIKKHAFKFFDVCLNMMIYFSIYWMWLLACVFIFVVLIICCKANNT